MRSVLLFALYVLVAAHTAIILAVLVSFFVLPFAAPWYVALPLCIWVSHLMTGRGTDCPLTGLENVLRRKLGMKRIGGFVGHYFIKPVKARLSPRNRGSQQ